jgi:hypothetical protein
MSEPHLTATQFIEKPGLSIMGKQATRRSATDTTRISVRITHPGQGGNDQS